MRKRKAFDDQASAAEIAGEASAEAAYLAVHEEDEHLPPGTDLTAAAFFDVDNTMMQGASIFHFARGLAARNFFTTGDLVRFAWPADQVPARSGRTPRTRHTAREEALAFVAGRQVSRDRRARRGDLRRADGGQDLPGHP